MQLHDAGLNDLALESDLADPTAVRVVTAGDDHRIALARLRRESASARAPLVLVFHEASHMFLLVVLFKPTQQRIPSKDTPISEWVLRDEIRPQRRVSKQGR